MFYLTFTADNSQYRKETLKLTTSQRKIAQVLYNSLNTQHKNTSIHDSQIHNKFLTENVRKQRTNEMN